MKEINSLDEMPVHQTVTDIMKMAAKLNDMIAVLGGRDGIAVKLAVSKQSCEKLYLDEAIVFEVVENLLSNAFRYAGSIIKVTIEADEEMKQLLISVNDDGKGFSMNDLGMATKPYYKDNKEEKSYHFGIGLYICKLLCEKHGGSLALANSVEQGAIVTASFSTVPLK
jgi:K+-sensing histidine kinase KdpD